MQTLIVIYGLSAMSLLSFTLVKQSGFIFLLLFKLPWCNITCSIKNCMPCCMQHVYYNTPKIFVCKKTCNRSKLSILRGGHILQCFLCVMLHHVSSEFKCICCLVFVYCLTQLIPDLIISCNMALMD